MENQTMTLATFNQCVDSATGVNKTGLSFARHGARHAGPRELSIISLIKSRKKSSKGKHAKLAGRHARPARAFF
jgi:hypothetical protein